MAIETKMTLQYKDRRRTWGGAFVYMHPRETLKAESDTLLWRRGSIEPSHRAEREHDEKEKRETKSILISEWTHFKAAAHLPHNAITADELPALMLSYSIRRC